MISSCVVPPRVRNPVPDPAAHAAQPIENENVPTVTTGMPAVTIVVTNAPNTALSGQSSHQG